MKKLIALVLVMCICVSLVGCKSSDYKMGMDMFSQKQYAAALMIFETLGDYKNSAQMIQECKYSVALELFNDGNYVDALTAFEELGTYQNSAAGNKSSEEMAKECNYNLGCMLFTSRDFETALIKFQELGEYRDSMEMVALCERNLEPVNALLDYIDENSAYISTIEEDGLEIRVENEATTAFINNDGNLEFVCVIGSPVVDWESMDLMDFHMYSQYEMPSVIDVYQFADRSMNFVELHIKMDAEQKTAKCTIEYIEKGRFGINTAKGTVAFNYSSYNGEASTFNFASGFNTDSKMFAERGIDILNLGLELMEEMLDKCDGEFSLNNLGWETLG